MEVAYTQKALADLEYWKKVNKPNLLIRISRIITQMQNEPYKGVGKPEPLKYKYTGLWSRRINLEHRIIYEVRIDYILIYSLKGHYDK